MKLVYICIVLVCFSLRAVGASHDFAADVDAYCQYIAKKNTAKSKLLNAPDLVVHAQNADNQLVSQNNLIAALSKDLSDFKKAKLFRQLINEECSYYRLREEAKLHIAFAIPQVQRNALYYKLKQIQRAKNKMNRLLDTIQTKIANQDDTVTNYYRLDTLIQKLENAEQDIRISLAVMKPPKIKYLKTRVLLQKLWDAEKKRQGTLNALEKQYNWALQLQTGAQQTVFDNQNAVNNTHQSKTIQPYVGLFLRYNLGSIASNNTLNKSLTHYTDWKMKQVNGLQNQLAHLNDAIASLKSAQFRRKNQLTQHYQKYGRVLKKMHGVDSIKAVHFKQQIEAERIMMEIEISYVSHLMQLLHSIA